MHNCKSFPQCFWFTFSITKQFQHHSFSGSASEQVQIQRYYDISRLVLSTKCTKWTLTWVVVSARCHVRNHWTDLWIKFNNCACNWNSANIFNFDSHAVSTNPYFCDVHVEPHTRMFETSVRINLSKPTGYVIHHQFNIQQLYAPSTLHLCVLYLSEQTATCATYSINWLFLQPRWKVFTARYGLGL